MTWKLYALLSGGAFVATYLFSGQGPIGSAHVQSPIVRRAPVQQVTAAETEIQDLASRLEARVHGDAGYQPPTRNPFEFGAVRHVDTKQVIAPKTVDIPPAPIAPLPPPFRLTGIAVDRADGMPQRTAILSSSTGVTLAKEGEAVAGYRVMTITDSEITLASETGDSPLTLSLSRP